ncbi:hypothetical protein GMDG_08026 [Pseudogymnoascus destructans 20631-21]|uniref:Uncharacterized protein n=1 Tax=Pseudogymnoascus destructans (strain ATCC MYA-4855 / 20631-21) TaxID=658429 RepID=L8G037_PSED2|nr:hypothetical protein GMDG_08026 [Pseudogymnoascus destructans 20631-21]
MSPFSDSDDQSSIFIDDETLDLQLRDQQRRDEGRRSQSGSNQSNNSPPDLHAVNSRAAARKASLDTRRKRKRTLTQYDNSQEDEGPMRSANFSRRYADVLDELEGDHKRLHGKDPEAFWDEITERLDIETRMMVLSFMRHDVPGAKDRILAELLPDTPPYSKAFGIARGMIMNKTKDWKSKLIRRITGHVRTALAADAAADELLNGCTSLKALIEVFRKRFTKDNFFEVFFFVDGYLDFDKTAQLGQYYCRDFEDPRSQGAFMKMMMNFPLSEHFDGLSRAEFKLSSLKTSVNREKITPKISDLAVGVECFFASEVAPPPVNATVGKAAIAKHQARWPLDGQTVEYRGLELQMSHVSQLIVSEYQQAHSILYEELMFKAKNLIPMQSWRLKDDLDMEDFGGSWLSHPGNAEFVEKADRALIQCIQASAELRAMFLIEADDGSMVLSVKAMAIYEATAQEFLKRLLVLKHIPPGPPIREPELLSVTWRNTARQRHLFLWEKLVMIYTQYHKGQQQSGVYKDNIRSLPKAIGDLLLDYIAYAIPLRQMFLRQQTPKALISPYESVCSGQGATVSYVDWRQISASICKEKFSAKDRANFDLEDNGVEDMEDELDLIAMAE